MSSKSKVTKSWTLTSLTPYSFIMSWKMATRSNIRSIVNSQERAYTKLLPGSEGIKAQLCSLKVPVIGYEIVISNLYSGELICSSGREEIISVAYVVKTRLEFLSAHFDIKSKYSANQISVLCTATRLQKMLKDLPLSFSRSTVKML